MHLALAVNRTRLAREDEEGTEPNIQMGVAQVIFFLREQLVGV